MIGIFGAQNADPAAPVPLAALQARVAARYRVHVHGGVGTAIAVAGHGDGLDISQASDNAGCAAVVYGNIDNPQEFTEGKSAAAAEVLLRLYRADALDRLRTVNGQYCAVIRDEGRQLLLLITDRLGTLPIHLWRGDCEHVFATQPWVLLGHDRVAPRADALAVAQVYSTQRTFGRVSSVAGVEALPPATIVEINGSRRREHRYATLRWTPSISSRAEGAERLATALVGATRRQSSNGAGRIGLMLSGGLDSRLVLAAAAEPPLCWTTAGFAANHELSVAKQVAGLAGARHKGVLVPPEETLAWTAKATETAAGLFPASQNFAALATAAAGDADTCLTGHGIDYMLRGMYLPARFLSLGKGRARLPALGPLPKRPDGAWLLGHLRHALPASTLQRMVRADRQRDWWQLQADTLDQWLAPWMDSGRPTDLWDAFILNGVAKHYTMTGMMAVRAELHLRIPAFDAEILEIALGLPPEWRVDGRIAQMALARLSPSLARHENANTGYPAQTHPWLELAGVMGKAVARKVGLGRAPRLAPGQKAGGWPDLGSLYRGDPAHRARFHAVRDRLDALCFGWFDRDALAALIDEHLDGRADHAKFLRQLLSHDAWLESFGIAGHA